MRIKIGKKKIVVCAALAIVVAAGCAWWMWPVSRGAWQRSAVLLENEWQYALEVEGRRIYFVRGDTACGLAGVTFDRKRSLSQRLGVGYFVSPFGHVRTDSALLAPSCDSLWWVHHGHELLRLTVDRMAERGKLLEHQLKELAYYERTHVGEDDGYEEMKGLYRERRVMKQWHDTLFALLHRALEEPASVKWCYLPEVRAYYSPDGTRRRYRCNEVSWSSGGGCCRLVEKALPEGASFVVNPWFEMRDKVVHVDSLLKSGGPVTAGEVCRHVALLCDASGQEYAGEVLGGLPGGLGVARFADGSCYQGCWQEGRFHGPGEYTDASSVRYVGDWEEHHLPGGEVFYPDGSYYQGSFLNDSIRDGAGDMFYADGSVYYGTWEENVRQGFGMYVGAEDVAKCGMWKEGRFQGERMLYTADRVYGIDISRYQHLNRRKRPCNIGWKYLRITHLGRLSRKRVRETSVSYPVSFIYIKATEGATVLNPYYKADRVQASRHGYLQGCYHFFSSAPVEEQLEWFFRHAEVRPGDLPPMLDLEPTDDYIRRRWGSDDVMFAQVLRWLHAVEQRYGVRPLLYVNQMFIVNHLSKAPEELKAYDLWVARYGEFKPYSHMVYWQISPDGRVSGIQSDVDINVFNGSKEHFQEYVEGAVKQ